VRQRRKIFGGLAALLVLLGGTAAPAGAEGDGRVRMAATAASTDPAGDAGDCRGDIVDYGGGYEPAQGGGSIFVVAIGTACANDPVGDAGWTVGLSYVGWYLDLNGDGREDFWALFENAGDGLHAELFAAASGTHICSGAPIVDGGGTFLGAAFAGGCIGQPASFRLSAEMEYDRTPQGGAQSCPGCTRDAAPSEDGWGPTVRYGNQPARQGYWMIGRTGETFAFGGARHLGNTPSSSVVDLEPTGSGDGYWTVDASGRVFAFGDATYVGGASGLARGETVTALSRTASGRGYWLFTNRGRVLAFGDAPHLGDMAGVALNGPVLDSIPTPSGQGYYMVGSDGGIFSFGDAAFHGSMGDVPLNAPVQSLVPDPDGRGYWLVASDGGIFAFEADFHGSMGDTRLNKPVTGMVGFGRGYLMVGEDGGIFTFGEAPFFGSLGDAPPAQPIVSVAVLDD
jgi:hypothetical protein